MKLPAGELWLKRMVCANIGKSRGPWRCCAFFPGGFLPQVNQPVSCFLPHVDGHSVASSHPCQVVVKSPSS